MNINTTTNRNTETQTNKTRKTTRTAVKKTSEEKAEEIRKMYRQALQELTPNKADYFINELNRLKKLAVMFGATKEKMLNEWHFDKGFIELLYQCKMIKELHKDKPAYFIYDTAHQTDKNYKEFCINKFYSDLIEIVN